MGLAQNAVCVLMNDVLTSSCIFRPFNTEKTQTNEGSKRHYVFLTQRALFNVYNEVYLRLKIKIYMYIKHDLNYIHRAAYNYYPGVFFSHRIKAENGRRRRVMSWLRAFAGSTAWPSVMQSGLDLRENIRMNILIVTQFSHAPEKIIRMQTHELPSLKKRFFPFGELRACLSSKNKRLRSLRLCCLSKWNQQQTPASWEFIKCFSHIAISRRVFCNPSAQQ